MQKRGIGLPTLILLIVISIVALIIVLYIGAIFFGYINSNNYEISTSNNGELSVVENSLVYDKNQDYVSFKVRRESEYGVISGIKTIIYDDKGNSQEYNLSINVEPYQTKEVLVNLLGKIKGVKKISIFPIYFDESSGNEIVGNSSSEIELTKKKISPIFVGGGGGSGGSGGGGSPSSIPTPSSTPTNCILNSASWSSTISNEGNSVSLTVSASNCEGQFISYIVKEDSLLYDSSMDNKPSNAIISNGIAISSWVAQHKWDYLTDPEFYFIATLVNDSSLKITSSNKLIVKSSEYFCREDPDNDNDGFNSAICSGNDCNDNDINVNINSAEVCSDYIDNDCNGYADCSDSACISQPSCIYPIFSSDIKNVSSSTISLDWNEVEGAQNYNIYIAPQPSDLGNYAWMKLIDSTSSSNYRIENLAADVDSFIRIEAINSDQEIIAISNSYAKTLGGQRANLDNPLREVHLVAPNIIELVLADNKVRYDYDWAGTFSYMYGKVYLYDGQAWQNGQWKITRKDGTEINVNNIYRRSIPIGLNSYQIYRSIPLYSSQSGGHADIYSYDVDHKIYLVLGEDIGQKEILQINGPFSLNTTLLFSDDYLQTDVIQLNQVGYNPSSTQRYAYTSLKFGDGGSYNFSNFPSHASVLIEPAIPLSSRTIALENIPISQRYAVDSCNYTGLLIIDNGDSCYNGTYNGIYYDCKDTKWGPRPVINYDCQAGTFVRDINLSALNESNFNRYRVKIPGVGVSYPTMVSEEAFFKAYYTIARGLYHNRWCGNYSSEFTEFSRDPDHCQAYLTDAPSYSWAGAFSSTTPKIETISVVGGHRDAGDYDLRPTHTMVAQSMLKGYEVNREVLRNTDGQLNIPESGNGIPDLLDEILWSIKSWEAFQMGSDGVGDACDLCPDDPENDIDGDGVCVHERFISPMISGNDNCPDKYNPDQLDSDKDGIGNACDTTYNLDPDGDGIITRYEGGAWRYDNCPLLSNPSQGDSDYDYIGDQCDRCIRDPENDIDGDLVCYLAGFASPMTKDKDNCPHKYNPDQADSDSDGIGNACDTTYNLDSDGDGIKDNLDNCIGLSNSDQADSITEDGGVRGGAESYSHPQSYILANEDVLPYWTYQRDASTTARVSALFAQSARLVDEFDHQKSLELKDRALRAYRYAKYNGARSDFMVYASSELYLLTNDLTFKQDFENYTLKCSSTNSTGCAKYEIDDGILERFIGPFENIGGQRFLVADYFSAYLRSPSINYSYYNTYYNLIKGGFNSEKYKIQSNSAFRSGIDPVSWGYSSTPTLSIPRAFNYYLLNHSESEKQQMIDMWSLASDYVLGANMFGYSWVTELGSKFPQDALHLDSVIYRKMPIAQQIPGILIYGPGGFPGGEAYVVIYNSFYPSVYKYPGLKYGDARHFVNMNEFTVSETNAPALELFASIASGMMPPASWKANQKDSLNPLPSWPSDLSPPSPPASLSSSLSDNQIILSWEKSTDFESGVKEYNIYRNGILIDKTSDNKYYDNSVLPSTNYNYFVSAINYASLESVQSNILEINTLIDQTSPRLTNVQPNSEYKISLEFNENIDPISASTSDFAIDNGIVIKSVSVENNKIILKTTKHYQGVNYNLVISGISDLNSNQLEQISVNYDINKFVYLDDENTIALYHFDGDFADSSENNFNLIPKGNVSLSQGPGVVHDFNLTVVKFGSYYDYLLSYIPDKFIMPGSGLNITIEGRFYNQMYYAGLGLPDTTFIGLDQEYDSFLKLKTTEYNVYVPYLTVHSKIIGDSKEFSRTIDHNQWHDFKIVASDNEAYLFIDGKIINADYYSATNSWTNNWTFNMGRFEGYFDEIRIRNGSYFPDSFSPIFISLGSKQIHSDTNLLINIPVFDDSQIKNMQVNDTTNFKLTLSSDLGKKQVYSLTNNLRLDQNKKYYLNISVSDIYGNINSRIIYIDVIPPLEDLENPKFTSANDLTISYLSPLKFKLGASDDRGIDHFEVDDLRFNIDKTGLLTFKEGYLEKGTYPITITVYDTSNKSASALIHINIVDDIIKPIISPIPNQFISLGSNFNYNINISDDVRIDSIWINDNTNFEINSSGHIRNKVPLALSDYQIVVTSNDSSNNIASVSFVLKVSYANPITSCNYFATSSGEYIVVQDLIDCEEGIFINSSNLILDCNNYLIDGTSGYDSSGIQVNLYNNPYLSNISIKNCNIRQFNYGVLGYNIKDSFIRNVNINLFKNYDSASIKLWPGYNVYIENVSISNSIDGIYFQGYSALDILNNSKISGVNRAINFGYLVSGILITNSNITNTTSLIVHTHETAGKNIFSNNIIQTTQIYSSTTVVNGNYFNTTNGNFYLKNDGTSYSQTCSDDNLDNICDSPLNVSSFSLCPGCKGINIDEMPIKSSPIFLSPTILSNTISENKKDQNNQINFIDQIKNNILGFFK